MAAGDITHVEVQGTLLTGSLATLLTVAANRVVLAIELHFLNVDTTVTYYPEVQFIPTGQSAAARYQVILPNTGGANGLAPGESRTYSFKPMLAAGTIVQAREAGGVANKISIHLGATLKEV